MGRTYLVSLALACALISSAFSQTYYFDREEYDVVEEIGFVNVCIRREGSVAEEVDITVEIPNNVNDDARLGSDFDTINAFSFSSGGTIACQQIDIVDDNNAEGIESFTLAIPSDFTTRSPSTTTIEIHDEADVDEEYYWEDDEYDVEEGDGDISVCMRRTGNTPFRTIQVSYGGAASSSSDYVQEASWTFPEGDSRECETITIRDDTVDEETESFTITIQSTDGIEVGDPSTTTVTITDDDEDETYYWAQSSYSAEEGDGSVNVCLRRSGSAGGARTIQVNYANGGAISGEDFSTGPSYYFAPGALERCNTISIIDDDDDEDTETFTVNILSTGNAGIIIGSPSTTAVTITDNDEEETIQWGSSTYTFSESSGSVTLAVTKSGTSRAVTATVSPLTGTATTGSDYQLPSTSVYIPASSTSVSFPVTIFDDDDDETSETFTLVLDTSSDGVVVAQSTTTVTISDNDEPPPPEPDRLSDGEIAGIVVGVVGLVIIIIIIIVVVYYLMTSDGGSGLGALFGLKPEKPKLPPPQLLNPYQIPVAQAGLDFPGAQPGLGFPVAQPGLDFVL